jgi:hypothetical protein
MHDPREPHLTLVKHILRYLWGSLDFELPLWCSTTSKLVVYTDVDSKGCPNTRLSTLGSTVFLGGNLIFWPSKRQNIVSRSSTKTEYRAVANGVPEACWLR